MIFGGERQERDSEEVKRTMKQTSLWGLPRGYPWECHGAFVFIFIASVLVHGSCRGTFMDPRRQQ
jgi:hypothetical protein